MEKWGLPHKDQIIMTKRQVSMLMASMLLFCLFVFIIGFFFGKHAVIDTFSQTISQESLHDQIDFLLTTQSLSTSQQQDASITDMPENFASATVSKLENVENDTNLLSVQDADLKITVTDGDQQAHTQPVMLPVKTIDVVDGSTFWYAQLIGFSTKKAAQAFVNKLQKHQINLILKTMISKTAGGKQKVWYQAVTQSFNSKDQVAQLVKKVQKIEKIHDKDIKIVMVK